MTEYFIKGFADHEAVCDRCGAELKQAIILASADLNGNPRGHEAYFGADCAGQLTRLSQNSVRVKARSAEPKRQAEEAATRQRQEIRRQLNQRERQWLLETYGVEDRDTAAQKSGKDSTTILLEWLDASDGSR